MLKLTAVLAFTIVDTGMAVYNKHMYSDNNTVGGRACCWILCLGEQVGNNWRIKLNENT